MPALISRRYLPKSAALSELPRATRTIKRVRRFLSDSAKPMIRRPSRLMIRSSARGCCWISASIKDIRSGASLFGRGAAELLLFDEAFALFDDQNSVDADAFDPVDRAAGPPDFYQVYPGAFLKAEVEPEVVVRNVTRAAAHLVHLGQVLAHDSHPRSYAVAVGAGADRFDEHEIVRISSVIAKELGGSVEVVDHQIDVPVIIQVPECGPPAHALFHQRVARLGRHFRERSVAVVLVKELALAVARVEVGLIDLRVDVTVGDEEVAPAVVVVVEELRPPSHVRHAHLGHLRGVRNIREEVGSLAAIEHVVFLGKV